jgi:hypothetical protein
MNPGLAWVSLARIRRLGGTIISTLSIGFTAEDEAFVDHLVVTGHPSIPRLQRFGFSNRGTVHTDNSWRVTIIAINCTIGSSATL